MQHSQIPWADPITHLRRNTPDHPVLYLSPHVLRGACDQFQRGFDGLVTYAVKANDRPEVLSNLVTAGITTFDVASPAEMVAVRDACPKAVLHYNNPVRSKTEINQARAIGVASWSVDDMAELAKLSAVAPGAEVSVRFALPVAGAAYHFGDKFGATPDVAVEMLRVVCQRGWVPSLSFHPGTQCEDPQAWRTYIEMAAHIATRAGVQIKRLNVGGGFAANRSGLAPDLTQVFAVIRQATVDSFGGDAPALVCEPGRAMVAESFTLAVRIKGLRARGQTVYLNDGIYGGLADLRDMGLTRRVRVFAPDGACRTGDDTLRVVYGPTCDSLDRLPGEMPLPMDAEVGDYVLFDGMGAYSIAMSTAFNGYGLRNVVTVNRLTGH